jgi:hypothetical protein
VSNTDPTIIRRAINERLSDRASFAAQCRELGRRAKEQSSKLMTPASPAKPPKGKQ